MHYVKPCNVKTLYFLKGIDWGLLEKFLKHFLPNNHAINPQEVSYTTDCNDTVKTK